MRVNSRVVSPISTLFLSRPRARARFISHADFATYTHTVHLLSSESRL